MGGGARWKLAHHSRAGTPVPLGLFRFPHANYCEMPPRHFAPCRYRVQGSPLPPAAQA